MKPGILVVVTLVLGCSGVQFRPAPPPDGPGTCASASENLSRLGGCSEDLTGWQARCDDASDADAEVGLRLPLSCWTNAASCDAFSACR